MRKKGNTVGSRRKLTSRQEEVLLGTLLGDGTMEINGKYSRLRIQHSIKQIDYIEWKREIFSDIATAKKIFCRKEDYRTRKKYKCCRFDTFSSSLLDKFYNKFYFSDRKRIPKDIDVLLRKPLSLAVWFMDDGYKRNDCNALRISTDSFSFQEQKILQKCLYRNFDILSKIHKKGKFWNIYIPSVEAKKFVKIIYPFIIPSMKYKISLDPVTTDPVKER